MIAYNRTGLDNLSLQQQVTEWYDEGCLTKEELEHINKTYPVPFYSPNIFFRIGLFILTYIIMSFFSGIIGLMFLSSGESAFGALMIIVGLLAYGALEIMVQGKHHFRSGVDDALLLISGGLLFGGISYSFINSATGYCMVGLLIAVFLMLRFTDKFITAIAFLLLLAVVYFAFSDMGGWLKALLPFVLMTISAITYLIAVRIDNSFGLRYYKDCLQVLAVVALFTLYASGNYYIVSELGKDPWSPQPVALPFGWLFWIFTITIPLLYLARGIQKKDSVLIRVGLILVAAFIFTVRFYYTVAPIELIMISGGILLIVISYSLTRYLKEPRHGFTALPGKEAATLQVEALILAQTFGHQHQPAGDTGFGGGSFGGGGASGEF